MPKKKGRKKRRRQAQEIQPQYEGALDYTSFPSMYTGGLPPAPPVSPLRPPTPDYTGGAYVDGLFEGPPREPEPWPPALATKAARQFQADPFAYDIQVNADPITGEFHGYEILSNKPARRPEEERRNPKDALAELIERRKRGY